MCGEDRVVVWVLFLLHVSKIRLAAAAEREKKRESPGEAEGKPKRSLNDSGLTRLSPVVVIPIIGDKEHSVREPGVDGDQFHPETLKREPSVKGRKRKPELVEGLTTLMNSVLIPAIPS